jgi:FkbM family methyltransferase
VLERTVNLAGAPVAVGGAETHRAFWDLADAGCWEPATLEAITRLLVAGSVYIDVGAWIGPTVLASARTASVVVAFEPDPVAAAELRRNIALNGLTNVEVREMALLDRKGELPLSSGISDELGLSVSSLVYGSGRVSVPVEDARTEAASDFFLRCSLLKIDVEGAEYRLIGRLAPYLRAHHPTLLLSLHGVHWRTRDFQHMPGWIANVYRRLRNAAERFTIVWRIRHYPYAYLDVDNCWCAISFARRWALIAKMAEQELLLTHRPYHVK